MIYNLTCLKSDRKILINDCSDITPNPECEWADFKVYQDQHNLLIMTENKVIIMGL